MKKVTIKIDAFGRPTIDAEGFTGGACKRLTEKAEAMLAAAGKDTVEEFKDSYYQTDSNEQQETQSW